MPDMSSPADKPRITKPTSMAGGPVYEFRDAVIYSNGKRIVFSFKLEGFPHGPTGYWGGLGSLELVVNLVNAWLDTGRLPPPYGHGASLA